MKFWELTSVMVGEEPALKAVLKQPRWSEYSEWLENIGELCRSFDRQKLDFVLPDELVHEVLGGSDLKFFLHEGTLRSYKFTDDDDVLSALSAYQQYGGTALEEALEKGSYQVAKFVT